MKKLRLPILFFLSAIQSLYAQNPTIQISPSQIAIAPGQSTTYHINVLNPGSFNQQLFFSISSTDLPSANYTNSFIPNPLNYPYTAGTDLSIQTNGAIPVGNYFMIITGSNGPVSAVDTCYLDITTPQCFWTSYPFPSSYYPSYGLTIDGLGNKWITGGNAIIKYDGNWTKYDYNNSNFPNTYIAGKITVDSQNNIWIPTGNAGLVKFDGTFWTNYNTSSSTIPSDMLTAVVVDTLDNVWIATSNTGIAKFDGTNWVSYNTSNSLLPGNNIGHLNIDRNGHIWMSDYPVTSLIKFDGTNWTIYTSANSCFTFNCLNSNLAFDENNNLWFASAYPTLCGSSPGMVKFNGFTWEIWMDSLMTPNHFIKNTSCAVTLQNNTSKLPVSSAREIFFDSQNIAWIATLDDLPGAANGLTRFDGTAWLTFNPSNSNLPRIAIRGIDSRDDSLWVISSPDFYSSSSPNFLAKYYCNIPTSLQSVSDPKIQSRIFPNPFHSTATLVLDDNFENADLKFYNVLGKQVKKQKIISQTTTIDREGLTNGIYFYQILTYNGQLISGCLVVE